MDYLTKVKIIIPSNIIIDHYDPTLIKQLYELFINNIIEESIDPLYLRFCGLYYCIKKQYDKMEEIYLKSYTYNNTILYFYQYNIIPDWIFELSNLTELMFYHCYITEIPDKIENLTQLTILDLRWNYNLTKISENIGNLKQLTRLNLVCSNNLTKIPESIGNLKQLTHLLLWSLKLTELPESIWNLTQLIKLEIGNIKLIELSENIGNLTQLTKLKLWSLNLIELPENIKKLTQLTSLDLSNNKLIKISENIVNLTKLTSLNLSKNKLIELPENIWNLTQLTSLDLICNELPELSENIGNLIQLRELSFGNNQLVKLPDNIIKLTQLVDLTLKCKKVPESIGNLTQLTQLNLSSNELIELPESIGKLTQLTLLNLEENNFEKIPESIGNLTQLDYLWIDNNITNILLNLLTKFIDNKTKLNSIIDLVDYYQLNNNKPLIIKYLKIAKNISPQDTYFKLYKYNKSINNIDKMIKYLTLSSDFGNHNSSYLLGQYYEKHKQYTLMKQLYKLSIKQGITDKPINKLANYYESIDDIDNMIKYLQMMPNNIFAINKLINYYESINDTNNMVKYLIVASKNNDIMAINKLISYYESINDIDEMIKYLLIKFKIDQDISIFDGYMNIDIIRELGLYYKSISNIVKMKEYYLMGVKMNDIISINNMITYYKNSNVKLDDIFKSICLELDIIDNKLKDFILHLFERKQEMKWIYAMYKRHNIKDIKINNQMQIIENKMKFSIIDKCPICYDETNLVLYECFAHYYCLDCLYQGVYKNKKCAICRMTGTELTINTNNIMTRIDDNNSTTPPISPRPNRPIIDSDTDSE